ncbi:TetR/AcrR family transcriptional regulator [Nocardia bovistercoris]|uniref:TetR/AcrR family transcriptional regulator n=1 Tax=Nocardia bovistercoris TaxID=2785916 RepID=UPI002FCD69F5
MESARTVYGERGWSGFNFRAVAVHASVSKDALYRRYESRADLLLAALTVPVASLDFEHHASLRELLTAVALQTLAEWSEPEGTIAFRLLVEATANPEIRDIYYDKLQGPHTRNWLSWIEEAIARGVLTGIEPRAFLDALLGGLMMRVMTTPPERRRHMAAHSETYVRELIDLLLTGAGYRFDARS